MPEKISQSLDGISETLLITLYARSRETQRPDGLLKDERAVEMVNLIDYDFSRLELRRHDEIGVLMRMTKFDNITRRFLKGSPDAVVVHIGCGLDTRFERVDNGRCEWFDLDMPDVIALRQKLILSECSRYHTLATSVFDDGWLEEVSLYKSRPLMLLAEGVLPYFKESQVETLFLKLRDHFPGCELVFDAFTPFGIWMENLHLVLTKVKSRLHWGIKDGKDLENWGDNIRLLAESYYYDEGEPIHYSIRLVRLIPALSRLTFILLYQLGVQK